MTWKQMWKPDKWKALLKPERRALLITGVGICGMLLILASYLAGGRDPARAEEVLPDPIPATDYAAGLEERLSLLVEEIAGVGRSRVMVTLENSGEYVYAQEEKRNVDKTTDPSLTAAARTVEKENTEQKYVLVDSGRQALVKTQLQPAVKGVVVICEGAEDVRVQSRVVNVVTTALGIPSTRVCVEKIKS